MLYPPSLAKILLGDYDRHNSPVIRWGCDNEDRAYANTEVDVCGLFICTQFQFLGASPDGIIHLVCTVGVVSTVMSMKAIKCPYIGH